MSRRTRQSNRTEVCPVDGCEKLLRNRAAERGRQEPEWVRCDSAGPHLCPNPATRQVKVPAGYDGSPPMVLHYCETCYGEMYGPYDN